MMPLPPAKPRTGVPAAPRPPAASASRRQEHPRGPGGVPPRPRRATWSISQFETRPAAGTRLTVVISSASVSGALDIEYDRSRTLAADPHAGRCRAARHGRRAAHRAARARTPAGVRASQDDPGRRSPRSDPSAVSGHGRPAFGAGDSWRCGCPSGLPLLRRAAVAAGRYFGGCYFGGKRSAPSSSITSPLR
ncbi:hypothetical protein ACU686_27360 [Yinghuangia aomiensis]